MGTRIGYRIRSESGFAQVHLYSNSSHPDVEPEAIFRSTIAMSAGISAAVEALLAARYPTTAGSHREGDRMFWIPDDFGDVEWIREARFEDNEQLVEQGVAQRRVFAVK